MDRYISHVLTGYDSATIQRLKSLLTKAGIRAEYSKFKPAIGDLKPSFALTVKSNRIEMEHVRVRISMMLSGIPGGNEVKVREFEVQIRQADR